VCDELEWKDDHGEISCHSINSHKHSILVKPFQRDLGWLT